jgi:predicted amidohydrolase YtcJ
MKGSRIVAAGVLLAALVAALALAGVAAAKKPRPADTVFKNAYVYTVNPGQRTAHAVAVRGAKIQYVGSNRGARAFIGKGTRVVDLGGKMLMPSFADGHAHPSAAASFLYAANLYASLANTEAYKAVLAEFIAANPGLTAYQGSGWSEAAYPGIGPLKSDLASLTTKPMALWSDGHHSLWVNQAALDLAGIDGKTPDPIGGVIERIPGSVDVANPEGVPSGCLRESACDMMMAVFPDFTVEQYKEGILFYEHEIANPVGITLSQDAVEFPGSNTAKAFEELARAGEMTVRIRGSLQIVPNQGDVAPQVAAAVAEKALHKTTFYQTNAAKFFADGVIEGHTGYLLQPYEDAETFKGDASFRGVPIWQPTDFNAAVMKADKAGMQIHMHAIGDAAVSESLDAIAYAEAVNGHRNHRPMITHLQLVDENDYSRFKNLGVTALPQPYWFLMDDYYHNLQVPFLGQTRADLEYPMKGFFDEGVHVASGSDFPVTPDPNALAAMQIGVMRWYPESPMGGAIPLDDILWPSERVTIQQMIRSFTIEGAYANNLEKVTGSIKVGKSADMVVLDRNIITCRPGEIGVGNKVLLTMFRGKTVYQDKAF